MHIVWKLFKSSHFGIFTNFCSNKIDLSGNTFGPKASIFKIDHFWHFNDLLYTTQNAVENETFS